MSTNSKLKSKTKKEIIEKLKKTPIIQLVCSKVGIARCSLYRWRSESEKFSRDIDKAIAEGRKSINDIAEMSLLRAIKDGNMTAINTWLRSNHPIYKNKLEVEGKIEHTGKLTKEQKLIIKEALKLASLN